MIMAAAMRVSANALPPNHNATQTDNVFILDKSWSSEIWWGVNEGSCRATNRKSYPNPAGQSTNKLGHGDQADGATKPPIFAEYLIV